MSRLLITQYHKELAKIKQYGGTNKETSIRFLFQNLLNQYCEKRSFLLIPEVSYKTKFNTTVRPDGTIKDALQLDWGYWESKDQEDNLDQEIENKFAKGYPNDNILFEDSQTAVLIQAGEEKMRVSMQDVEKLDKLLNEFIEYQRPEVKQFYQAIEQFKTDLPTILVTLRDQIDLASQNNQQFITKRDSFLEVCQKSINPQVTPEDIREMMIQHILTEDIFLTIFEEAQFHRENNIARELTELINTFLGKGSRKQLLSSIQHYYKVIKAQASQINNHHEKQKFLKAVYENFYKAYNPKSADRLGIVYTPNEIVKFMVESVDYLCYEHFGKLLEDEGVEILDPATGTGTFITELIEYIRPERLRYKYQQEIHCNEVAILPYYIANLNIEASYFQKMKEYVEFENICFVDTLDHTSFLGKQMDLFALSVENTKRIHQQNQRNISVIIGNPPYNANQQNENDNNKNRVYSAIDLRIKETYIKASKAQKTKVYDMYSRFFRWATNRLAENGILAFITNSSFINAKTFDGFRKCVADDFSYVYIIDLGGDMRSGDKTGNVFNIMVGVAISFMIKKPSKSQEKCKIFYYSLTDSCQTAREKLNFLNTIHDFSKIPFNHIHPNNKYDWINQADTDFDKLLPLCSKDTKLAKSQDQILSLFKLFSLGVVTNRDEWVFDFDRNNLNCKISFFINNYLKNQKIWFESNQSIKINDFVDRTIKWTSELEQYLVKGIKLEIDQSMIVKCLYRPFSKRLLYYQKVIVHRLYQIPQIFPNTTSKNTVILYSSGKRGNFAVLSTNKIFSLDIFLPDATQSLPFYRYDDEGNKIENITDWGLKQFQDHYSALTPPTPLIPKGEGGASGVFGESDSLGFSNNNSAFTSDSNLHSPSPSGMRGLGGEGNLHSPSPSGMRGLGGEGNLHSPSPSGMRGLGGEGNSNSPSPSGMRGLGGEGNSNSPSPSGMRGLGGEGNSNSPSPSGNEGAGGEGNLHSPSPSGMRGLGGEGNSNSPSPSGMRGLGGEGNPHSEIVGRKRQIPPELLEKAKQLRKKQTPAEKILWECLRSNRLDGFKFRRQHNIGSYIVDFYCHSAKLVIELDGEIHDSQQERDANRDEYLRSNNLIVIRFKNEEILNNLEHTLITILSILSPVDVSALGLGGEGNITKLDIFHYVYGVLHNPKYREKYELNLKRDFPRIPFYDNFFQWVEWGKQLMELHLNYETITPYPLQRIDTPLKNPDATPKPKLKLDKTKGEIYLDEITTLTGIPPIAFDYILGNRSALDWILDQYKEKKPKDQTIAEKFNTYRFADYKETVIDLLMRVTTVSIETMKIIQQMTNH